LFAAEKINLQGSRNVLRACLQSNVTALSKILKKYIQQTCFKQSAFQQTCFKQSVFEQTSFEQISFEQTSFEQASFV
jgi:uncharacterized protein YjbI with pentapeptide repeats